MTAQPLWLLLQMLMVCEVVDWVKVLVASDPAQFVKRINMISPNGDGKNDVLEFKDIEKYGSNTLTVYNRWGDVIFQKINYQSDAIRFDGTYKGLDLPAGTYYYVLAFNTGEIKQTFDNSYWCTVSPLISGYFLFFSLSANGDFFKILLIMKKIIYLFLMLLLPLFGESQQMGYSECI